MDLWVSYGAAEPSVAESVRAALGCPRELQPKGNSDLDNASDGEDDAVASEATIAVSAQADDEKATKVKSCGMPASPLSSLSLSRSLVRPKLSMHLLLKILLLSA